MLTPGLAGAQPACGGQALLRRARHAVPLRRQSQRRPAEAGRYKGQCHIKVKVHVHVRTWGWERVPFEPAAPVLRLNCASRNSSILLLEIRARGGRWWGRSSGASLRRGSPFWWLGLGVVRGGGWIGGLAARLGLRRLLDVGDLAGGGSGGTRGWGGGWGVVMIRCRV